MSTLPKRKRFLFFFCVLVVVSASCESWDPVSNGIDIVFINNFEEQVTLQACNPPGVDKIGSGCGDNDSYGKGGTLKVASHDETATYALTHSR
jgi:hypothetical protein